PSCWRRLLVVCQSSVVITIRWQLRPQAADGSASSSTRRSARLVATRKTTSSTSSTPPRIDGAEGPLFADVAGIFSRTSPALHMRLPMYCARLYLRDAIRCREVVHEHGARPQGHSRPCRRAGEKSVRVPRFEQVPVGDGRRDPAAEGSEGCPCRSCATPRHVLGREPRVLCRGRGRRWRFL